MGEWMCRLQSINCQQWLERSTIFAFFGLLYATVPYLYGWNYAKKVKVNLSLCVIKHHIIEDVLESGSIIPHIHNFGIRWRWMIRFMHQLLLPKERTSDSCRIGDWVPQQVWMYWGRAESYQCWKSDSSCPAICLITVLKSLSYGI
jgi:hypothetical protein